MSAGIATPAQDAAAAGGQPASSQIYLETTAFTKATSEVASIDRDIPPIETNLRNETDVDLKRVYQLRLNLLNAKRTAAQEIVRAKGKGHEVIQAAAKPNIDTLTAQYEAAKAAYLEKGNPPLAVKPQASPEPVRSIPPFPVGLNPGDIDTSNTSSVVAQANLEADHEIEDIELEEDEKTLQPSDYNIIEIPGNGWCLYLSVIGGAEMKMLGESIDISKDIGKWNAEALKAAQATSSILQATESEPYRNIISSMLQEEIPETSSKKELQARLDTIDADSKLEEDIKEGLKESVRIQFKPESATYTTDRAGNPITDVADYITKLSTPLNPEDLNAGPTVWPDAAIVGLILSGLSGVTIHVYQPVNKKYKLITEFKDNDADPVIHILYTNRNHYSVIIPKEKTDKRAMSLRSPSLAKAKHSSEIQGRRFQKAINEAKQKLSVATLKEGIAKYGASIKASKRLFMTGQFQGEIIIAGERVRLEEKGFEESALGDVVSFHQRFFPQEHASTIDPEKGVFAKVFAKSNEANVLPPCDAAERSILKIGLGNRLINLYKEVQDVRQNDGDVAHLRQKLEHYQRLEMLIKQLETMEQEGRCEDYNADGSPAGFSNINDEFDEEIRTLLRQFAFMLLQSKQAVSEFDDYTEDAKKMVEHLRKNALSHDEMNGYLLLWREQAAQTGENIPSIIGEILDGTNTQTGILELMMEDALNSLFTQTVSAARQDYAVPGKISPILTEFDTFVANLKEQEDEPKQRIVQLVSWIVKKNKDCWDQLGHLQTKADELEKQIIRASADKEHLEGEIVRLSKAALAADESFQLQLKENVNLSKNLAEATAAADAAQAQFDTDRAANARASADLQAQLAAASGHVRALQQQLADLQTKMPSAEGAAAAAAEANAALSRQLAAANETIRATEAQRNSLEAQLKVGNPSAQFSLAMQNQAATQGELDALRRQLSEQTKELGDAKGRAVSEVAAAHGLVDVASAKVAELTRELAAQTDLVAKAALDKAELEKQLKNLNVKLIQLEKEYATARAQVDTGDAAIAALTAAAADKVTAATAERDALKARIEGITAESDLQKGEFERQLKALTDERDSLKAAHAEAGAALATANSDKEGLHAQISAASRTHNETVAAAGANAQVQLDALNLQISKLSEMKDAAAARASAAEAAAADAAQKMAGLNTQIQTSGTDKEKANKAMAKLLAELQMFAADIVSGKDYKAPGTLTPQAGNAFNSIVASISKLKQGPGSSPSNQVCFLSYFITFFMKALFFLKTDTQRRQTIMQKLEIIANDILVAVKGIGVMTGTPDKQIIYKIMNVIFNLIDTTESLFINKTTRAGIIPTAADIGLSVVKTADDPDAKKIIIAVYDRFASEINSNPAFLDDMNFLEQSLFKDMLIAQPKIFFNKPIPIAVQGAMDPNIIALTTFPSFTYAPNGISDLQNPSIKGRFQVIDIPAGYAKNVVSVSDAWQDAIFLAMQDATMQYTSLFATFIIFGRQYIVAAKDEFSKLSCKIPALLENPAAFTAAMAAEKVAPAATPPPPPPPPPATCGNISITIVQQKGGENPLTKSFTGPLTGDIDGIKNLKRDWYFVNEKSQENPVPNSEQSEAVSITFPSPGEYRVYCAATYNKDGTNTCNANPGVLTVVVGPTKSAVELSKAQVAAKAAREKLVAGRTAAVAGSTIVSSMVGPRPSSLSPSDKLIKSGRIANAMANAKSVKSAPLPPTPTIPILSTFTKTLDAIFKQIKGGSMFIRDIIKQDLKEYSDSIRMQLEGKSPAQQEQVMSRILQNSPIAKLIQKHAGYANNWNGATEISKTYTENDDTTELTKKAHFKKVLDSMWASFKKGFNKTNTSPPLKAKTYFRNLIFDIFNAYVKQYDIEGATTLLQKIDSTLGYFRDYIGSINLVLEDSSPIRDNKQNVYQMLNITDKDLKAFAINGTKPPPLTK
jgi:hypothetical protein